MRASRPRSQAAALKPRTPSSSRAGSAGGSPASLVRNITIAFAVALLATPAFAAVQWQDPDTLGVGQTGSLDLVFADSEPTAPVALPHIDGLRVVGAPSQASDISIMNGRRSTSLTLSYPVRAERTGTLHVPAFDVETTKGTEHVAALDVEAGRATMRDASGAERAVEDAVDARLTPTNMTPYAGEVVDLDLRITLTGNQSGQVVGAPTWEPGALTAEPWSDGHAVHTSGGNAVRFHTRVVAPQAGRVELAPADQEVQLETSRGRDPFAGFDPFGAAGRMGANRLFDSFFGAQTTSVTAHSNVVQLDVRPLPQPAPAGFTGAVGQFTLESTLTPEQPKTGEPVTWTLTLSGTGNWPSGVSLPARAVPSDLRTLQPKQRSSFGDNGRFSGEVSEDLVIVPNQPGELALAPVQFSFFNPDSGRYETVEARPPTLRITGAPLPAAVNAPAPVAATAPQTASSTAPQLAAPLTGTGTGIAPLPWTTMRLWLIAPFALAILVRLARRAWLTWQTHPSRLARRTARALRATIVAARDAATIEARIAALLTWQRVAARVLGVDLAAPTSEQLSGIGDPRWAEVWAGSERAVYARGHSLPADWCALALALCTPPRRRARRDARPLRILVEAATAALLVMRTGGRRAGRRARHRAVGARRVADAGERRAARLGGALQPRRRRSAGWRQRPGLGRDRGGARPGAASDLRPRQRGGARRGGAGRRCGPRAAAPRPSRGAGGAGNLADSAHRRRGAGRDRHRRRAAPSVDRAHWRGLRDDGRRRPGVARAGRLRRSARRDGGERDGAARAADRRRERRGGAAARHRERRARRARLPRVGAGHARRRCRRLGTGRRPGAALRHGRGAAWSGRGDHMTTSRPCLGKCGRARTRVFPRITTSRWTIQTEKETEALSSDHLSAKEPRRNTRIHEEPNAALPGPAQRGCDGFRALRGSLGSCVAPSLPGFALLNRAVL